MDGEWGTRILAGIAGGAEGHAGSIEKTSEKGDSDGTFG